MFFIWTYLTCRASSSCWPEVKAGSNPREFRLKMFDLLQTPNCCQNLRLKTLTIIENPRKIKYKTDLNSWLMFGSPSEFSDLDLGRSLFSFTKGREIGNCVVHRIVQILRVARSFAAPVDTNEKWLMGRFVPRVSMLWPGNPLLPHNQTGESRIASFHGCSFVQCKHWELTRARCSSNRKMM